MRKKQRRILVAAALTVSFAIASATNFLEIKRAKNNTCEKPNTDTAQSTQPCAPAPKNP